MSSLIGQTFCSLLLTARKITPCRSYSQQRFNCPRSTFNMEKLTGSAFPMAHLLRESVQQMRIFGRSTTGGKNRVTYHNWHLQAKRNVNVLVLYYQTQTNTVTSTLQLCKSFDLRKLLLYVCFRQLSRTSRVIGGNGAYHLSGTFFFILAPAHAYIFTHTHPET